MKLAGLCLITSTVWWAMTLHGVLLVAIGACALWLLVATDRANQRDAISLAKFRHPGGKDLRS